MYYVNQSIKLMIILLIGNLYALLVLLVVSVEGGKL